MESIWTFIHNSQECPNKENHRGPQGPNEDIATCRLCNSFSFAMRPEGETFGNHLADCSLPIGHQSFCVGGGAGHPPSRLIKG